MKVIYIQENEIMGGYYVTDGPKPDERKRQGFSDFEKLLAGLPDFIKAKRPIVVLMDRSLFENKEKLGAIQEVAKKKSHRVEYTCNSLKKRKQKKQ